MKVANSNEGGIPTCNLLLLNDCEYGYKKGESFDIKFVNNLGYPLKYRTLIFEIKSDKFYKGVDYQVIPPFLIESMSRKTKALIIV